MIKRVYFRCKSLGKSPYTYDMIEASLAIQINDCIKYLANFKITPKDSTKIQSEEWLKRSNIESSMTFDYDYESASEELFKVLEKFINKYVKEDRYILVVFNDLKDDHKFLEQWIYRNERSFKSYFFPTYIDVRVLFTELGKYKIFRNPEVNLLNTAKAFNILNEYPKTSMDELKLLFGVYQGIQQFINPLYNHE